MDSIVGVKSSKFTKVKVAKLIFSLIFMAACGIFFALKLQDKFPDKVWLGYTLMGVACFFGLMGFLMFCTSFKRKFSLIIFTRDISEFANFHSAMGKKEAQQYVQVIEATPGKEFSAFVKEIGSVIIDVQNGIYG